MNITTKYIEKITMSGAGRTFNVLSCQIVRTLNSIPQASVTVAVGYDIVTGSKLISDLSAEELKAIWTVDLAGTVSKQLFKGYIVSMPRTTVSSPFGSKISITFKMAGTAVKLAMMSATGYHFWGEGNYSGPQVNTALYDETSQQDETVHRMETNFYWDFGNWLIERVAVQHSIQTFNEANKKKIQDEFTPTPEFSLQSALLAAEGELDLELSMGKTVTAIWASTSIWQAIISLCRGHCFLNISPCGDKLALIPAFPWNVKEKMTVSADGMMGAADNTITGALIEDISAVAVEYINPLGASPTTPGETTSTDYAVWPPGENDAGVGTAKIISVPPWLNTMDTLTSDWFSANKKKDGEEQRVNVEEAKAAEADKKAKTGGPSVAQVIAKAFFAEAKNRSIELSLKLPWDRLDFMDLAGYVIKVENIDMTGSGKKETVYGMLNSFTFSAMSTASGSQAMVQLSLSHVRDKTANDAYAMALHPIYESFDEKTAALEALYGDAMRNTPRTR